MKKATILALCILLGTVEAFSKDYHVSKNGNDFNPNHSSLYQQQPKLHCRLMLLPYTKEPTGSGLILLLVVPVILQELFIRLLSERRLSLLLKSNGQPTAQVLKKSYTNFFSSGLEGVFLAK